MAETQTGGAERQKLVLVDAYSLLFRAFFGGRNLTTSDNRPTGALYGFAGMLFSLLADEKPDYLVICWDAPARTFRKEQFEEYKAHRPPADPQLRAQFPVARELAAAFGMQSVELPGYEADDLIGTLAARASAAGQMVTIVTGDTDQLQLVSDHVHVRITSRGVSETKWYDEQAVRDRYGLTPAQIPDWKALVGDTSDNIPGVQGIGDKTATSLLQKWGSLEKLLAHTDQVTPPRIREALESGAEQARLSKHLATIDCNAPIELELAPYEPTPEDWRRLRDLFLDLEFRSLLTRIPELKLAPLAAREFSAPEAKFTAETKIIASSEDLAEAIAAVGASGAVALLPDASAAPPMRARLRGIGFAPTVSTGYYIAVQSAEAEQVTLLDPGEHEFVASLADLELLLADPAIARYGHNAKFIEILLERAGAKVEPFAFDTMVAAYLLNSGRSAYPLMDLAENYLGVRLEAEDTFDHAGTLANEAALVCGLVAPMREQIATYGMTEILDRVEMPLIPALAAVEQAGLLIDRPYLSTLSARMEEQISRLAAEVYALAGEPFQINSTKQLQTILFEKLGLPHGKKTKTGYSTGADLLESLAGEHPIAGKILEYREVTKLKATYADALERLVDPETGRIHTSLNQTVASTGRLSSSDPNLQNIPVRSEAGREIRRAFISPEGRVLLSCDYSQIELRILAHVTHDPALVHAFEHNEDIHAATAATVFEVPLDQVTSEQRRQAKTINFAVIYGQSGFGLASLLGVSPKVANEWIEAYFERLPGVRRYVTETTELAHRQKYVSTLLGRRRYVPEIGSPNQQIRQAAERAAVNMPIQGTAADIMKLAMIDVFQHLCREQSSECTLLLQVHDELLLEVEEGALPKVASEVRQRMEGAFALDVPLRVDARIGTNWAEMYTLVR